MRDRFLGGECINLLSNFSKGSNEEIMGRESQSTGFRILVPPLSLRFSPDSGRVEARRAAILGRFLVQRSHLLCCLVGPGLQGYD